jgi:adenosylcobinamide-phosphate synthase
VHFYLGLLVEIYFCYQILAFKSLKTESMKVYHPLMKGNLAEARMYLSYIVGRDTQDLDAKGIMKAAVETVAENTTDGVVAPLIFMAVGGAPLAFLYKAINTMDSMIGYKNDKYFYFGKFAARIDDAANFIPARIAAMAMIIVSYFLRLDTRNAIKIYIRDRKKHKSPNSAQTESVCAGALDIQLGGDARYFGKPAKKPTIGDDTREIQPGDIILANRLMYATGIFVALLAIVARGAIWK